MPQSKREKGDFGSQTKKTIEARPSLRSTGLSSAKKILDPSSLHRAQRGYIMASASSNATSGWPMKVCACGAGPCIPTKAGPIQCRPQQQLKGTHLHHKECSPCCSYPISY